MRRLHADRGLAINVRVRPEHSVRCQREDLDEMLGNLLDNACKWGKIPRHHRIGCRTRIDRDHGR